MSTFFYKICILYIKFSTCFFPLNKYEYFPLSLTILIIVLITILIIYSCLQSILTLHLPSSKSSPSKKEQLFLISFVSFQNFPMNLQANTASYVPPFHLKGKMQHTIHCFVPCFFYLKIFSFSVSAQNVFVLFYSCITDECSIICFASVLLMDT